jgi:hypothetical protein
MARAAVVVGALVAMAPGTGASAAAQVIEGHQGATSTTATKHVTVIDRTDLPDAPAITCGAAAVAPVLVSETSTADTVVTFVVTVGPDTIFVGEDQQDEYHVVAGEIDTTTLSTTTTTLHQTWQGRAAADPCPTEGHQGFTATTASKHVTEVERTELPELAATSCGTAAGETMVGESATSAERTDAIVTAGPATIMIGVDQSVEYHVVAGEVDTTTLVTYTTTLHQTWQATAAGAPCATGEVATSAPAADPIAVAPAAVTATPGFTG